MFHFLKTQLTSHHILLDVPDLFDTSQEKLIADSS